MRAKKGSREYKYYKNIKLCEEWEKFTPFMKWALLNEYKDNLEIDRIDNLKGYYPDNCRWANRSVQLANRRKRISTANQFIGVYERPNRKSSWRVIVTFNHEQIFCKSFETELQAVFARDKFILENKLPHTLNLEQREP